MEKRLLRLGGATVLVASLLLVVVALVEVIYGDNWTNSVNIAAHAIAMPAGLLLIVGLPALVAAMASRAPLLSAIGFTIFTLSVLVYDFNVAWFDSAVLPYLIAHHIDFTHTAGSDPPMGMLATVLVGGFAEIIGSILLGVAILRSGAFSRVAAILLIAGGAVHLATSLPLFPEWLDTVTEIAMLAGLAIAGWQLAGLRQERRRAANLTTATTSA